MLKLPILVSNEMTLNATKRICIIGGGAAGMMSAATILETAGTSNFSIHLFDKNPKLGVKVAITGGGRCNLTTGIDDMPTLIKKYPRGASFIKNSLAAFSPKAVRAWFTEHDLALRIDQDNRVFPASNKGAHVVAVFEEILADPRVELHLNQAVTKVRYENSQFLVSTDSKQYEFDILLITTGGNAYQETGSTGDGYAFAKALGHTITKLKPSLSSFTTSDAWNHELAGLSLSNAGLGLQQTGGARKQITGPIIFTHQGISGPAVFELAAELAFTEISAKKPLTINLIADASYNFERCNAELIRLISEQGNAPISSILMHFVPRRLAEKLLILAEISDVKAAELLKEERIKLAKLLTGELELQLDGRTPGVEFVTAGGVELTEVEKKTMQSKILSGLYFAGEILNIDAVTGGFNLQAAWSTGRAAGIAISKYLVNTSAPQ